MLSERKLCCQYGRRRPKVHSEIGSRLEPYDCNYDTDTRLKKLNKCVKIIQQIRLIVNWAVTQEKFQLMHSHYVP